MIVSLSQMWANSAPVLEFFSELLAGVPRGAQNFGYVSMDTRMQKVLEVGVFLQGFGRKSYNKLRTFTIKVASVPLNDP